MPEENLHSPEALRKRAGELLRTQNCSPPAELSPEKMQEVIEELKIHQIELQMQNEELQRTHAELEKMRKRYFLLYDLAPVGYFRLGEEALILEANLTAAHLLGVERMDLVKKSITQFIQPEDQDIFYQHDKALLETGSPQRFELRLRKKGGAPIWVRFETTMTGELEKGDICLAVMSDITELKTASDKIQKLHAELEQRVVERTAQLEETNKELESFSYSISHDLRSPLRAIDGFSLIVMEDYGSMLPAEGQRHLQTIRQESQKMGLLINNLLGFSRLSQEALTKQTVDTATLVADALGQLMNERNQQTINLRIGTLPPCWGDPALLKQVWVNLLSNALKYTRKCDSPVVEIGCQQTPEDDIFFVKDNGTGFDMQYAKKLFGVFQRMHSSDEFEGTGCGLAIVKRIVHRHGGRVWAEAEKNRGATFYFTLKKNIPTADCSDLRR